MWGRFRNFFREGDPDSRLQRVSITTIHGHDEMALPQVNGAASLRYGDIQWGWLVCASELHHWREWFEDT